MYNCYSMYDKDFRPKNVLVPQIFEEEAGRMFTSDIISRLVKDRIVFVTGEIEEQMASVIVAELLFLQAQDPEKEISMYINSPGGSVDAGMMIVDTMNFISCPVRTIAMGMAASMGSIILSNGHPGMRQALPHTNIMIHQPLGGAKGQQTDVEIMAQHLKACREMLGNFYVEHCSNGYITAENVQGLLERDNYLTPEKALEYGLIDEVVHVKKYDYTKK